MFSIVRRATLLGIGSAWAGLTAAATSGTQAADALRPAGAGGRNLIDLGERLRRAPRRRDFRSVPMILETPDQWDSAALREVIAYRGGGRQVWDNTDLHGLWLNLMRNALNTQVFSFRHADFLVLSATHGTAHLALFDQAMWDKYQLSRLAGGVAPASVLGAAQAMDPARMEDPAGPFGAGGNTIRALQARGVVFMACHNAIWEVAAKLQARAVNPDRLSHEAMAAELTNHLVEGVVLTPGIVGTIPQLQQAGFHYAT